jgi:hypothetical protein
MICAKNYPTTCIYDELLPLVDAVRPGALFCRKPGTWSLLYFWRNRPQGARASSFTNFLDRTRHTIVGRTPLDEWSVRPTDLYLTTHNTHNRQTSMPPEEFEPTVSAEERPQTYALDRTVTGIDGTWSQSLFFIKNRRSGNNGTIESMV